MLLRYVARCFLCCVYGLFLFVVGCCLSPFTCCSVGVCMMLAVACDVWLVCCVLVHVHFSFLLCRDSCLLLVACGSSLVVSYCLLLV